MSVSPLHEAPRLLLEERPELLFELLRIRPPEAAQLVLASADVTQTVPMERHADAVLLVQRDHTVVAAYVLETQLAIDPEKLYTWPLYAAAIHARHRCPTTLVVLTTSPEVAAWARRPIESLQPGFGFRPHVLGPDDVGRVDQDVASASPERTVLGALFADEEGGPHALEAALRALGHLDAWRAARYLFLLKTTHGESVMPASPETLQRLEEGLQHMQMVNGLVKALKTVMSERGIPLTELGRRKLYRCEDEDWVQACLRRAVTATTEADVFGTDVPKIQEP